MRKTIAITLMCLFFVLTVFGTTNVKAATPTLETIATAFNNNSTVKKFAEQGSVWNATTNENKLNISIKNDTLDTTIEYVLNENILSCTATGDDSFNAAVISTYLIDTIGTLTGYVEGDLLSTISNEEVLKYTIEKEGLEIKNGTDGTFSVKIDITKTIPLLDFTNVYLEVKDLEDSKEYLAGEGQVQQSKGNIWFNKIGYEGEPTTIIVGEKNGLTENTYKSLVSIIEVMFDQDTVKYFKENYSSIEVKNKEFIGFKIETGLVKNDFSDGQVISDEKYVFARVVLDKENVVEAVKNYLEDMKKLENTTTNEVSNVVSNNVVNTVSNNTTVTNTPSLPNTGEESNPIMLAMAVVAVIAVVTLTLSFRNK